MEDQNPVAAAKRFPLSFVLIFILLASGIGAAGYLYYHNTKEYIKKDKQDDLSAIADLKVSQIVNWRMEMIDDAENVRSNTFAVGHIIQWLRNPGAGNKKEILGFMNSLQKNERYKSVILLDVKGDIRLSVPYEKEILGPDAKRMAGEAIRTGKIAFSDLYRSEIINVIRITIVVPLMRFQGQTPVSEGELLLRVDPYEFLYPRIQSWPTPSRSAETLLVRREGDELVFLNELRHKKDTALRYRFKVSEEKLPAAMAVRGKEGIVEGIDYRGVRVLAALRKIPDSPWFLVAKVDAGEIYAPLHERLWFLVIFMAVLIGATGLGIVFIWHGRELETARREEEDIRRLNEELAEREERFRSTFEQAAVGIAHVAPDGQWLRVNQKLCSILGYMQEELNKMTFQEITYPDDLEKDLSYVRQVLADEISTYSMEKRYLHKNNSIVWINLTVSLVRDPSDRPHYFITVMEDIGRRKKAEESLKKVVSELERSNKELEQFAYIASHDLQEPLRMVSSYVQLLAERHKGRLDADADDFIHFAVDGARRMQVMINDLLAYSRVGTKGRPFAPVDCNLVLKQALLNLKLLTEESGAKIVYGLLPIVTADASQVTQVFQNLISNAIKFHGEKGPEINVEAEQKGNEWVFSVRDNGIGFEQIYAEKIFDIFKRLYPAEKYPGSGIGLSICRKIVERHGGRIRAESEPGKGSVFYFTIPVKE